jgi:calcineurin-like phosphoesterase family protein
LSLSAGAWFGGRRRVRVLALAAAAALASSATPAAPATITRTPVADAYVRADQPDAKLGTATTLRADASPQLRSYLRFSVPALPGPVTRALLRLRSSSTHTAGYRVFGVADNGWSETAVTFATAPPPAPAPVGSSGPLTAGAWSEVDVTPLVAGDGLVSMALGTTSSTAMTLSSREAAAASRPQLVISTGEGAPVDGDPVIAAAGDIACDPADANFADGLGTADYCRQRATSDLLVDADLAAVLALGDIQYFCASSQAFQASYVPSWGRVKSITRPAIGNHEYLTQGQADGRPTTGCDASNQGAAGYFAYFGAAVGAASNGYYSYDIGAWHLIALNGECSQISGGCSTTGAQGKWLAADLAAHPAACTLAYFHAPLFSSGGRAVSRVRPFWDLLHAGGVDVILNGHDHIYERFAPQTPAGAADPTGGIRQFTVGTGGEQHTFLPTIAANSEVRNAATYGVLKLTLHATGYD